MKRYNIKDLKGLKYNFTRLLSQGIVQKLGNSGKLPHRRQKGLALVQIIIATTLFSFLSLAVGQLILSQQKAVNFLEDKLSKIDLQRTLIGHLSSPDACSKTLSELRVQASQNLISIKDKNGNVVYSTENKSNFDKLTITNIALENLTMKSAPRKSGTMVLKVFTKRQRSGGGPLEFAPIQINLKTKTGPDSSLVSCTELGAIDLDQIGDLIDDHLLS